MYCTLRDKVVDEDANVRLGATNDKVRLVGQLRRAIYAGDDSLTGGLLVASGAIDLSGQEQVAHTFRFERGSKLTRIDIVVLDTIAVLQQLDVLQAAYLTKELLLVLARQRARHALRIDDRGVEALRLQPRLVDILAKADDLRLERGTIARSARLLLHVSIEMDRAAHDLGHFVVRVCHVCEELLVGIDEHSIVHERERHGRIVGQFFVNFAKVDSGSIKSRRCSLRNRSFKLVFRDSILRA